MHIKNRRAFSLIELIVVMAIITILIALILPAVQGARAAARRTQCKNNLHNLGIALNNYHATFKIYPPGWLTSVHNGRTVPGYTSWLLAILPQLEQHSIFTAFNTELPAWKAENQTVVRQRMEIYICPSDPYNTNYHSMFWLERDVTLAYSNYVGSLGTDFVLDYRDLGVEPDGVLYRQSRVRTADVVDGTSNTLLAGEKINEDPLCRGMWGFGATSVVTADAKHGISLGEHALFWGFSSHHLVGAHFVMCDGSAGMISRDVDQTVFLGLSTRQKQEPEVERPF